MGARAGSAQSLLTALSMQYYEKWGDCQAMILFLARLWVIQVDVKDLLQSAAQDPHMVYVKISKGGVLV